MTRAKLVGGGTSGPLRIKLDPKDAADLANLEACSSGEFRELALAAGLDPRRDFRTADLSGLPFGEARSDLTGFDFSNANLMGTSIRNAIVNKTTVFTNKTKLDLDDSKVLSNLGLIKQETKKPSDFSISVAKKMIKQGVVPPDDWIPWLRDLNFGRSSLQSDRAISSLIFLETFSAENAKLYKLNSFSKLSALYSLSIGCSNNLSDLSPLSRLICLRNLTLDASGVDNVKPLRRLENLTSLSFYSSILFERAKISHLLNINMFDVELEKRTTFDLTPLSEIPYLKMLGVVVNSRTDLRPVLTMKRLQKLSLIMPAYLCALTSDLLETSRTFQEIAYNGRTFDPFRGFQTDHSKDLFVSRVVDVLHRLMRQNLVTINGVSAAP